MHPEDPRRLRRYLVQGTAFVVALVEAVAGQARPVAADGVRLNTRNTPEPAGDAYQTGRSLLAAGDVTGALSAFRQAVLDAPQSVDALNGLAVCYDRLGRYDLSRSYYDAALAVDADSALVLNNLGYSLYLQGRLEAAIPVLQHAMAGADSGVVASSQRVLTLVAARLRENKARDSAAQALAEMRHPQARIELAANNEAQLVFDAPVLDRRLVASLGDDAALVTIADPVKGNAALVRQGADGDTEAGVVFIASQPVAETTIGIGAATADAPDGPRTIYFTAVAAPAGVAPFATVANASPQRAKIVVTALQPMVRNRRASIRPLFVPGFTPAFATRIAADHKPSRRRLESLRSVRGPVQPVRLRAGQTRPLGDDEVPAWLLASRRVEKGSLGGAAVARGPRQDDALAAFDSDDPVLNAFAARMRGTPAATIPAPASVGDLDPEAARAAVIARLEALLARVRPA